MAKLKEVPKIILNFSFELLKGNTRECYAKLRNASIYLLDKTLSPNSFIRYSIWQHNRSKIEYTVKESNLRFAIIYFWQNKLNEKSFQKLKKSLNNQLYKNFALIKADQLQEANLSNYDYICFIEQGDDVAAHSLCVMADKLSNVPDIELIYSDEDVINPFGCRVNPYFKTAYSPFMHLSHNYVNAFLCLKNTESLTSEMSHREINQRFLYELTLKLTGSGANIFRISDVLYHRSAKNFKRILKTSTKDIVEAHLHGLNAKVIDYKVKGLNLIRFYPAEEPKISIIIPFKDKVDYLRDCVKSIETKSTYKNYEILLVNNRSCEAQTFEYLKNTPHRVIDADIDFNYSRLNNIGAQEAQGEYLLLLNNDTKVITPDWLESTLGIAQLPHVGAVGLRMLYANNLIQETGSFANNINANRFLGRNKPGYKNFNHLVREYAWFAGACLFVSKQKYFEVGGLNENMPMECNDSDFCFKLIKAGYYNVYNPHAEIYHYECVTRKKTRKMNGNAYEYMSQTWGSFIGNDPFHNPNFSREKAGFGIAL